MARRKKEIEENIINIDYESEMMQSYINYAMAVIGGRAIPDVRDGFKPVHRRILYDMIKLGLTSEKAYKKSVTVVGDVLGKYHPHGDSSVYEAMVRMAQDFSLYVPLIDGHGNFGSIDGDPFAAFRYTESRLEKVVTDSIYPINLKVVDMKSNFDDTKLEPVVLPIKFPNLLVNGANGIAVGMATKIPTHNLSDAIDMCIAYLDKPKISIDELIDIIIAPDFPTGGIIVNKSEMREMYKKGEGRIRIRAKTKREGNSIIVTEIPYTYSGRKEKLLEQIATLVTKKRLDEISNIQDESSKDGIRIVIETKRGTNMDNFEAKLFKYSGLEDTFSSNFLALFDGEPKNFNLLTYVHSYVEFLRDVNVRMYSELLAIAKKDKEILDGLDMAYDLIDPVIELIRGSSTRKIQFLGLTGQSLEGVNFKTKKFKTVAKKFKFTEVQANVILDLKLTKLSTIDISEVKKGIAKIEKMISYYEGLLKSNVKMKNVIKKDMLEIKDSFGGKRKTLLKDSKVIEIKETKRVYDVVFTVDKLGYVKMVDVNDFNKLNGEKQNFVTTIKTKSDSKIVFLDKVGNLFSLKLDSLDLLKNKDKGIPIEVIMKKELIRDNLLFVSDLNSFKEVILFTNKGYTKRISSKELDVSRYKSNYTKLNNDEHVLVADNYSGDEYILESSDDFILRMKTTTVSVQKRNARGVIAMKLDNDAEIVNVEKASESKFSKNKEVKTQNRGTKGKKINKA